MVFTRLRSLAFGTMALLMAASFVLAVDNPPEPKLTGEQEREFLLHAKVINSKHTSKGVTSPWRLTLSDGTLTHDAVFQTVDEQKFLTAPLDNGSADLNFKDTYHFDIAGYELAKLLGLDDMVPMYAERTWNSKRGAIGWWLPVKFDDGERRKRNEESPDLDAWNKQMYKVRVFDALIYDTDPNLTNRIITTDWRLWMIDFTRAFRLSKDLQFPNDLVMCDRDLLDKLRKLDASELMKKTEKHLTKTEVQSLMARRDKIVQHFDKLVAEKGHAAVLY